MLGRYSTGKGLDEIVAGARIARERGLDVRLAFNGTAGTPAEQAHRGELERLVAADDWATVGGPVPRTGIPELLAGVDTVAANFDSADKIVFEACASCRPPLASYAGFAPLFAGIEPPLAFERGTPETLADRLASLAALSSDERAAIGRELRERVARDHSVEAWAERMMGLARMRQLILHLQKVAGISGSEAHLLALLPRLRERGWNVRMLMLHENEPGAWDFARELEARGVPLDALSLRGDVDPVAFVKLGAYLARTRPALLHTHLVHADAYGLMAGTLAGVPVRFSTKHGFNWFRETPYFGVADRAVASLAHVHVAISRGLARYLEEAEGFDGESFQIVHYGIDPGDAATGGSLPRTPGPGGGCSASVG